MSKKGLAVELSRLATFEDADARLEQHATDSELAAELLWDARMREGLDDATVVDLGAGTGILGLGAALLGANVTIVEKARAALDVLRRNAAALGVEVAVHEGDVASFHGRADLVVMNPPFGTREEHADRRFLSAAFRIAPVIYTIHKSSTDRFVRAFAHDHAFQVALAAERRFPLKQTMSHHTKRRAYVDVTLYRLERE